MLALLPLAAAAELPGGGRVVAGEAAIDASSAAQVRVLQSTPRAVLRWDSFNIGAGNSVVFKQPHGTGAATLNIVGGDVASTLAGSLRADGSVLLVNRTACSSRQPARSTSARPSSHRRSPSGKATSWPDAWRSRVMAAAC